MTANQAESGRVRRSAFPNDTGSIDLLTVSKDKQELLVVKLKQGCFSDAMVGQIQRYMAYVKEDVAEDH